MSRAPYLWLDFQSRARPSSRTLVRVALGIGVVSAAALGALVMNQSTQLEALRLEERRLQHATRAADATATPHDAATEAQLERANRVVDALALPWDDMLLMIEAAGSKGVALLSLAPDSQSHAVRIVGQARSLDDVLAYMGRLGAQPLLAQVVLVSYQGTQSDGVPAVQFMVSATWKP